MANNKNTHIIIYAGPGVAQEYLRHIVDVLSFLLSSLYQIKILGERQTLEDPWEKEAALFILPGGADIPYHKSLQGKGNQKIRTFIEQGGSFLGICAGSYYAGKKVVFAKDTSLEVIEERELSFFPGVVEGPVFGPYEYGSYKGARAALVFLQEDGNRFLRGNKIFYAGGGYFVEASKNPSVKVFATYQDGKPGIVECFVGKGKALLSAFHIECNPALLSSQDPYLIKILPDLYEGNAFRLYLFRKLLRSCGIQTKQDPIAFPS